MRNAPTRTAVLPGDRTLPRAVWLLPLLAAVFTTLCLTVPLGPFQQISRGYIDLEVYRLGIEAWRAGGDLYGKLPETASGISLPFIYPPFATLALGIFALLPWDAATVAYLVSSIGAVALTLFFVATAVWPEYALRRRALLACTTATPLALLLEPVFSTLDFGQVNLLLMALVAADCLARSPKWPRGMLLGIAAAIKLTPAAFVLYFLVRRDYKAAATAAISGAVATVIGFAVLPDESLEYWFGGFGNVDGLSGSAYQTNQSIQAVLARLEVPATAATLLWLLLGAALIAAAVIAMRRAETMPALALSINAVVALLISPISWSHHWVWAAPALLALVGRAVRLPWRAAVGWYVVAVVVAALFITAPHHYLPGENDRELAWSPVQQIVGNSYVWCSVLLLAIFLVAGAGRGSAPQDTDPDADTGEHAEGMVSASRAG